MTAKQYRDTIQALGLSQAGGAQFFKVDDRTSRRWALPGTTLMMQGAGAKTGWSKMKSARRRAQNAVTSQSRPYIHFDEREDVISSLELLGSLVSKIDKSPRDWKWCIIAAHSALQGALVCILSGTAEIGALREDLQSAWLEWFDNRKGKEPDTKLADFKTLLKWAGNSSRMVHADEGPPLKLSAPKPGIFTSYSISATNLPITLRWVGQSRKRDCHASF